MCFLTYFVKIVGIMEQSCPYFCPSLRILFLSTVKPLWPGLGKMDPGSRSVWSHSKIPHPISFQEPLFLSSAHGFNSSIRPLPPLLPFQSFWILNYVILVKMFCAVKNEIIQVVILLVKMCDALQSADETFQINKLPNFVWIPHFLSCIVFW